MEPNFDSAGFLFTFPTESHQEKPKLSGAWREVPPVVFHSLKACRMVIPGYAAAVRKSTICAIRMPPEKTY